MKRPGILENIQSKSTIHLGLLLVALFATIYSLTYSGTFLTDDEHILVARSLSLAFQGCMDDARIYGNTRIAALSSLPPGEAAQATNIEPLQEVAGALLARIADGLNLGFVQTIFLLNIWVVALTAGAVFFILSRAGYRKTTALVASLLFGFGTQAWVYSRTFFRDPLAMLCLALAWGCTQAIIRIANGGGKRIWLAWMGLVLSLVAGILAKNTAIFAIPVFLIEIFIKTRQSIRKWDRSAWKVLISSLSVAIVLVIFWLLLAPRWDFLARFTPLYHLSLLRFFFTTPHPHFLQAVSGPFISPNKSIFLYSPVLIIAVIALVRHPKTAWSGWAYTLLLVLGQALFYDVDWWGHRNWGLRFILPAIPLLVMGSAPVVENWMATARSRANLVLLGSIAALVQVVGILPLMLNYYVDVANAVPPVSDAATIWNLKYNPILWHMNWIFSGRPPDLAVVRVGNWPVMLPVGLIITALLLFLVVGKTRHSWLSLLSPILVLVLTFFMVFTFSSDPEYQASRKDLSAARDFVTGKYRSGDVLIIKSYASPIWYYWMNWGNQRLPWTSLPFYFPPPDHITFARESNNPSLALDEISLRLLQSVQGRYGRIWLILPSDSPGGDLEFEAAWLERIASGREIWEFQDGTFTTRLFLFNLK
jgi:hypothetical protein